MNAADTRKPVRTIQNHGQPLQPYTTTATIYNHQQLLQPFTNPCNHEETFTSIHNQTKQANGSSQVLWPPSCDEKICKVWASMAMLSLPSEPQNIYQDSMCLQVLPAVNGSRGGRSKYHKTRRVQKQGPLFPTFEPPILVTSIQKRANSLAELGLFPC